ncbi:hypothetical protein [Colwellia psychrerythraea]|uniref:Uncharacterized protein n=1 Tax=Colwellia psychrerythraea TaxID=28229 RepID=A0A099KTM1_COLPS|nr:hypothetical protein [Colwellia psychrerythraea]KGJ93906.1 hypothetical protein GAB14E_2461 [Colwellia psychrerythraea]
MASPLVISHYWSGDASDADIAIIELKFRLNALGALPSHVTVVSAGEACVLLDPIVFEFYQWLSDHCHVTFISAACTSVHAGILDFYHSDLDATLVISIELGKSFQQSCLNSLGIGNDNEQKGLDVIPCVGFIALKRLVVGKKIAPHELVVEQCQLISQQPGMTGTQLLIRQLYQELKSLPAHVLPVSFNICSLWAKSLFRGLDNLFAVNQRSVNWLSSIESCQRHYLSLKPLLELQLYRQKLKQNSLLFFTLGGGGRVGMLQLGKNIKTPIKLPKASFEQQSLLNDIKSYQLANSLIQADKSAYYKQIRATLKYPHSRYRGKDNHYFKWQIPGNIEQAVIVQPSPEQSTPQKKTPKKTASKLTIIKTITGANA